MCEGCGREMSWACLNAWAAALLERLTGVTRDIDNRSLWWKIEQENDQ